MVDLDDELVAPSEREPEDVADYDDEAEDADGEEVAADEPLLKPRTPHVRLAAIVGLVVIVVLGGLTGWLGMRAQQSHRADEQREVFLQVGRQGAVNLTTIDWQEADGDIARILDSATGTFHDEFQQRSQPFVDAVKKAKSKSVGTVTEAGLESESDDAAEVLVAVSVKTTTTGVEEERARAWRMRISVQKVGAQAKVSNVEFVP